MIVKLFLTLLVFYCTNGATVPKKEADYNETLAMIVPHRLTEQLNLTNTVEAEESTDDDLANNTIANLIDIDNNGTVENSIKPDLADESLPPFKNLPKDTIPTLAQIFSGDFWNSPPFSIIASDDLEALEKSNSEIDAKKIMEGKLFIKYHKSINHVSKSFHLKKC